MVPVTAAAYLIHCLSCWRIRICLVIARFRDENETNESRSLPWVDEGCGNSYLLAIIAMGAQTRNIRRWRIDVIGSLTRCISQEETDALKKTTFFFQKETRRLITKRHYDSSPTPLSPANTKCTYCTLVFDRSTFSSRLKI